MFNQFNLPNRYIVTEAMHKTKKFTTELKLEHGGLVKLKPILYIDYIQLTNDIISSKSSSETLKMTWFQFYKYIFLKVKTNHQN